VSPQEATANSTLHHGSHGFTPIVGSYFCREPEPEIIEDKKRFVACMQLQPVCN